MTNINYGRKTGRFITTPLDYKKCGKSSNYRAHLRRGQKPCERCRMAESDRGSKKDGMRDYRAEYQARKLTRMNATQSQMELAR